MSLDIINQVVADSGINFIRMKDIIRRDGKAGQLFNETCIAYEGEYNLNEIIELEKDLTELKSTQPNYQYIEEMITMLAEAKANVEIFGEFEALKAEVLRNTGDKILAEDMAYELIYG